jgi:leader peptidase (prepilin peptidase)/N-methyltransferase
VGRVVAAFDRGKFRALLVATLVGLLIGPREGVAAPPVAKPQAAARVLPAFEVPLVLRARVAVLTTLGLVWFFFLGAALGSYLNVVVYRLPRGRSSGIATSRCPKCDHAIRPYDNIPVIGWLMLRGKCRDCHAPISPRYVLVELLMGALFVGLLCVEVFSGGANLPVREIRTYGSQPWIDHFGEFDLIGIFAYHALLLWVLVGWLLFRVDRVAVHYQFVRFAVVTGSAFPMVWSHLRPVHFQHFEKSQSGFFVGVADGLVGMAAGLLIAWFVINACTYLQGRMRAPASSLIASEIGTPLIFAGIFLGWQAVFSVGILTAWWLCLGKFARLTWPQISRWPLVTAVLLAVCTQLVAWRWLAGVAWWPGPASSLIQAVVVTIFAIAAATIVGWSVPQRRKTRSRVTEVAV